MIAYSKLFARGTYVFINSHLTWSLLLAARPSHGGSAARDQFLVLFPKIVREQHLLLRLQPHTPSEL